MKRHVKILSIFLTLAILVSAFVACTDNKAENETSNVNEETTKSPIETDKAPDGKTNINIAGMTGPTGIGLVELMDRNEKGEGLNNYNFSLYKSAQEIVPLLVQGKLDIAAVPANLAAIQFNKNNGFVQVLAINTLGVLSILEKGNSINSVADLKGKTIMAVASGKGATPEFALNYILKANGLDPSKDVTVEWKSEVTEIIAALKKGESGIALLPQPAATKALTVVEGLREAINLNDAWNQIGGDSKFITGVIVARKDFIKENPHAIETFLKDYAISTEYVNTNVEKAAALVAKYKIADEATALKAIPKCSITFIKGTEMKQALSLYLGTLFEANPKSIGGKMPANDFYYVEK